MRLSRQGYGTKEFLENIPVDEFFDLVHYENFVNKYQVAFTQLNRKK